MDYRRDYTPGATYFFTVITAGRKPILIENIDRLRHAFRKTMAKKPFHIDAIVILPDHLHTIWKLPEGDCDYSFRWQLLKRLFSSGLSGQACTESQVSKREKGHWQRRFWEHKIRNQQDWNDHVNYIHYNPVKHGYVTSPAQWGYSSFQRFVEEGILSRDWGQQAPRLGHLQAGE